MATPYLLHHLLEAATVTDPSKEAVVDLTGGLAAARRSLTYETFYGMAAHCSVVLQAGGIERGDRVAIYLPKSAEEAAGSFAASMAGGVFVDVNSLLVGHQVAHILSDCGAKWLITSVRDWKRVREDVARVESLRCVFFVDEGVNEPQERVQTVCNVMRQSDERPQPSLAIGEDLAGILYTSGSTGKPRGVMLSHRNLLAGSRIVSNYLELGSGERILSILPFSFDYGFNQLLTTVQHSATIVLLQYRFPAEIVRTLAAERITGLAGVPLIWAGLVHHTSGLSDTELPHLRYVTNSGGAVPTAQ